MTRFFLFFMLLVMGLADISPALAAPPGPAARAKMRGKVYVHRPNYRTYKGGGRKARMKRTVRYRQRWFQFWRKRKKTEQRAPRRSRNTTIGTGQ